MHTIEDRDGMKVMLVSKMQDRADKRKRPVPGRAFDPPLEIVHVRDIATFYGFDIRDVWGLVFENQMGQRVPYNSGEQFPNARTERYWKTELDDHGQPQQVEDIRDIPFVQDKDDGMYMRLKDVLYYANAKGWKKGAGMPTSPVQAAQSNDIAQLVEAVKLLVQLNTQKLTEPAQVAATLEKPKRTLSTEQLAAMKAGRERKKQESE